MEQSNKDIMIMVDEIEADYENRGCTHSQARTIARTYALDYLCANKMKRHDAVKKLFDARRERENEKHIQN